MIERLAIVGLGLLGGSVAKAVRARRLAREVVGIGRDAGRLEPARKEGVIDRATTDLAAGLDGADMVLLAVPVITIERLLPAVAENVAKEAVVTDVGSTKAAIVRKAEHLAERHPFRFVGSHPMAGSERSGYAVAREDLFQGATVIVTPTDATDAGGVKDVAAFWEAMGARVSMLDPVTHDRVVAAISHLPHLVAYALVEGAQRFEPTALDFAARGFRDTTRIAASDPVVWQEIFAANRMPLLASLASFRDAVADLERLVEAGDARALQQWLARVKAVREALG